MKALRNTSPIEWAVLIAYGAIVAAVAAFQAGAA